MKTQTSFNLYKVAVSAVCGMLLSATSAHAIPVVGDVVNSNPGDPGGSYSLVHFGSDAGGSGNPADWWNFDGGQSLTLDLDANNDISLLAPRTFTLTTNNLATGSIVFEALRLDLNDPDGSFAGGELDYTLNESSTSIMGTFIFDVHSYSSIFNTSAIDDTDDTLEFFLWGGDVTNNLGIDLGFKGEFDGDLSRDVPVPATGLLLLLGLAGLSQSRRRA